jgi:PHD/YefM family antitoxin component YafN of YafNO toxin-antitoxin module
VIKNNQPSYVVLSEKRYRELIEAEDEAYIARVRTSLADVKAGRVRRFKSAGDLLKAIEAEDEK